MLGNLSKRSRCKAHAKSQPEHTQIVCEDCDFCVQQHRWTFFRGSYILFFLFSIVLTVSAYADFDSEYILKKFYAHYQSIPRSFVIKSTATIEKDIYDSIPHEIKETTDLQGSSLTFIEVPEHLSGKQISIKNNGRSLTTLNDIITSRGQFYEPIFYSLLTRTNAKEALLFLNGLNVKIQPNSFPVREKTTIPEDLEVYCAIGEEKQISSQRIQIWFDQETFLPVKTIIENERNERFTEYYNNYSLFKIYPQEIEVYNNDTRLLTYTISSFRQENIDENRFNLSPFSSFPSQKITPHPIDKKDTVALYTYQVKTRYSLGNK